jgi:nucleotide-binding universal stress UspA family protein
MAKRILVPLSGGEHAEVVLPLVAGLAQSAGSTVRLLRVAPDPQPRTAPYGRVVAYVDQETDRLEAESQGYLRGVEARLDGVAVERRVAFGDPAREIVREAEVVDADLIALATAKARWLRPRLLGKVARRVLRRAPAPVTRLRG